MNITTPLTMNVTTVAARRTALLITLFITAYSGGATPLTQSGVVIESVDKNSALAQAGISPGDTILAWEKVTELSQDPSARQECVTSFFHWKWLEMEYSPQGDIALTVENSATSRLVVVRPGVWSATVRPRLTQEAFSQYEKAKRLASAGDFTGSLALWSTLLKAAQLQSDLPLVSWLHLQMAELWKIAGDRLNSDRAFAAALEATTDPRARIISLIMTGNSHLDTNRFHDAETAYGSALALASALPDSPVTTANISYLRASNFQRLGNLNASHELSDKAHALLSRVAPNSLIEALTLNNLSILERERGDLGKAQTYAERAHEILLEIAPQSLELSRILISLGTLSLYKHQMNTAATYYHNAWLIQSKLSPEGKEAAATLNNLGLIANDKGDQVAAEDYYKKSYAIFNKLNPGSLQIAQVVGNLGALALLRDDFVGARALYERALTIQSKMAPDSLAVASTLINLGTIENRQGNLSEASEHYERAYTILNQLAPNSLSMATILLNLGTLAERRSEFDKARDLHERALAIFERLAPRSPEVITNLTNLGSLAHERGEYDVAKEYLNRALRMARETGRTGDELTSILGNLGVLAFSQGDLNAAEVNLEAALEIIRRKKLTKLALERTLHNLGNVASARGHEKKARDYFSQSLLVANELEPDSLSVATELNSLGSLATKRKDWERALSYYSKALSIVERLAPGSYKMASSFKAIATIYYRLRRFEDATYELGRAIQSLEDQVERLDGSRDTRSAFMAEYKSYYTDMVYILVKQGRNREALEMAERSKAREFAAMLRERDLLDAVQLPTELNNKRQIIRASYDRLELEIESWNRKKGEKLLATLIAKRQKLYREDEALIRRIRQDAARFAAIRYPEPLSLESIQLALEPGTLALFYSVGDDETEVFAVSREGLLATFSRPYKESVLRSQIETFRHLMEQASTNPVSMIHRKQEERMAEILYSTFLGPASQQIEMAQHILIIPDGPLHLLPWGALRSGVSESGTDSRFLLQWKPVHVVVSVAVYSQTKLRREVPRGAGAVELAAFGAATFKYRALGKSPELGQDRGLRSAVERSLHLSPLPATRDEVEGIVSLFSKSTRVFLGQEATEENAKSLPRDTRIVHFATHAILDERSPLNSAVVLSIPEKFEEGHDNGLLQAWEIFEQVRLNADLVVLSACESGLGKEMGGEGLIGLTRAFQYAGARSVMASLWKISDRTTAELMVRFYRHLKDGLPKDEALRAAQMEFIHGPIQVKNEKGEVEEVDASAPYYWAAFQIYGDWQ